MPKGVPARGNLKPADRFMWRIDDRGDFSDSAVFTARDASVGTTQHSIAFAFLCAFADKG